MTVQRAGLAAAICATLLLAAGCATAASTGSVGASSATPAEAAPSSAPSASPTLAPAGSASGDPLPSGWTAATRPASPEVVAVLEGRIDAFNRGDFEAAAAYWTEDGRLIEYEDEAIYTQGRAAIAKRLAGVHGIGVRMAPVGTPLQFGRLVAEPVRFEAAPGVEGYGEGILVFEMNDDNQIVWESVCAWLGPG